MTEQGIDPEREPAGRPAKPPADEDDDNNHRESDWADEAAKTRAADDPRRSAPHDRSGVPTTESFRE